MKYQVIRFQVVRFQVIRFQVVIFQVIRFQIIKFQVMREKSGEMDMEIHFKDAFRAFSKDDEGGQLGNIWPYLGNIWAIFGQLGILDI